RSAAAADYVRTDLRRFLCEKSKIFWRRPRIDGAIADAFRKTGVRHGGKRQPGNRRQISQYGKQKLRVARAVRAERLNVFFFQFSPGIRGACAAEGGTFIGIGKLGDDGKE